MYQVLARKWRPKGLDELVGQDHVARTLRNAFGAGRVAHAYLFSGVRGTGKTTVARIVAKSLNCEKGPTAAPCGECVPCREIADGRAIDVLEIDAASRTGVDDIRELQEVVVYAPVRDRYKVLIVDEVHMLSKSAFNALLKTLEEPPPRVVFVLATTELHKVLPTILSRCQVFEFRRVPPREVAAHLRRICDAEGIRVSDRVLDRIAREGEGSVRDSLSVLERVLAFCGTEVRDEEAFEVLGAVRLEVLVAFVEGMAARDAASLLEALEGVAHEGHDLVQFWSELLSAVRDVALLRAVPGAREMLSRSPDDGERLRAAAEGLGDDDLTRIFRILAEIEYGLRTSSQPRFLFESCLLRIAALGAVRPIEELIAGLPEAPRAEPQKKKPATADPGARRASDLIDAVRKARPMLEAMIEEAGTVRYEAGAVVLAFPPGAEAVRRMFEREDTLSFVRTAARDLWGEEVPIRVETAAATEEAPAAPKASFPTPGPTGREELFDRVRKDPSVRMLLTEFGAQIVDVRPLEATPLPEPEVGDDPSEEPA